MTFVCRYFQRPAYEYPSKGCVTGTKLFIADSGNNRVLVWNTIPTTNQQPPDFALGQVSTEQNINDNGAATASTLSMPTGVASDGTHLFVVDSAHHRVLIWNSLPTHSGQAADLVLGQPNMTSSVQGYDPTSPGAPNAHNLNSPQSVAVSGTKLVVTDTMQSRVLIWNTIPTSDMQDADVVVGQPDFASSLENNDPMGGAGTVSAKTLDYPYDTTIVGSKLVVADQANNRVLIFSAVPATNQPAADFVIGQPDMVSNANNNDPILGPNAGSAKTLSQPMTVGTDGTKLFVGDLGNKRAFVFNTVPAANQVAADVVIGQPGMVGTAIYQDATGVASPYGIWTGGSALYITDQDFSRIMVYSAVPTSNGASADIVLGQGSFTDVLPNNAGVSATYFNSPQDVATNGTHLFVADAYNNRVLIWNTLPSLDGKASDVVVGQTDMTTFTNADGGGVTARSLNNPSGVASDGTHLAIADGNNNRVLIWNSIPTSNYAPANVVVGQADFTHSGFNQDPGVGLGTAAANTLAFPTNVACSGNKLMISDTSNYRVMIYNVIPTVNNANANIALGQSDFATRTQTPNMANKIGGPTGIFSDGTKLYVSDWLGNRIMLWNTFPTATGQAADTVFGQTDLTSSVASPVPSLTSLYEPIGLAGTGNMLFIADSFQYRILAIPR